MSDFVLYRSFYCGICCETGRLYGQLPRFATNYDFAFLSALVHDCAQSDIVIEEHGCVLNPKRKAILQRNPLLTRLVNANIMLCYQKAEDGVKDGDGVKYGIVKRILRKPYAKAQAACPEIAQRLKKFQSEQNGIEKNAVNSIDRAADPFACLMRDLPELLIGKPSDENLKGLCYNIGKFVYLCDALDDIADDEKKHRYNPFLCAYGDFVNRSEFIKKNRAQLEFCFYGICGRASQCFNEMRFTQSYGLLKNIVESGMRNKTDELLNSVKKLPPPGL